MIAISIQKPDTGNMVAVRPDVTLVKGLAPVMNIVLAFSMLSPVSVLALPPLMWLCHNRKNRTLFSSKSQTAFTMLSLSVVRRTYCRPRTLIVSR